VFGGASVMTGLVAALWHMRWWIGALLLAMAGLTVGLVVLVIALGLPAETTPASVRR
jgi:hypothetical protein